MTASERDPGLTRLFEAERRSDESAAPPLDALLARPARPRVSPARALRQLDVAAALAAILAAGALVLRSGSAGPIPRARGTAETVQLVDWQSPTDFLLETPGDELLTQIPEFEDQPTSDGAPAPSPTKGVSR